MKAMENDQNECTVCTEKYTVKLRVKITCNACDYSACKECYRKVISSIITSPYCINCDIIFTREFLVEKFSKGFITKVITPTIKKFLLADNINKWGKYFIQYKEKIDKVKKLSNILALQLKEINKLIENIEVKTYDLGDPDANILVQKIEFNSLFCYYIEKKSAFKSLINKYNDMQDREIRAIASGSPISEQIKDDNIILVKCIDSNCDGYQIRHKCNKCNKEICTKCREEIKESHKCDPNSVLTISALNNDNGLKKCPKCNIYINRIEGCSQMWCTNCNAAFSWITGKIINSNMHYDNPHYTAFMRKQNASNESQCNELTTHVFASYLKKMTINSLSIIERRDSDEFLYKHIMKKDSFNEISNNDINALIICIFRAVQAKTHINGVQSRKFIVRPREFDIIKTIFAHIEGELDEDKTMTFLHKTHKKNLFNTEIYNVIEYYKFGMDSIAGEIIQITNIYNHVNDMLLKLKTLLKSTNDMFKKIYDTYEMTTMQINYQYRWVKYSGNEVFDVSYKQHEVSY
jgi:hypothetical protein